MTSHDANPLSGISPLDLSLDEITAPEEGRDGWAAAGGALVDRMAASLSEQREANERAAVREVAREEEESSRPLSERDGCRFTRAEQPPCDEPEWGC